MEVHHHSHTARKKWTHYFWEFLMLFLAVFCGFFAEYQLEHKIEKERGKQYIFSMYEDLRSDTTHYSSLLSQYRDKISVLGKAHDCYELIRRNNVYNSCFKLLITTSGGFPDLINTDRTLQQLKNSGGLRLLSREDADSITTYDALIRKQLQAEHTDVQQTQNYLRNLVFEVLDYDAVTETLMRTDSSVNFEKFPLVRKGKDDALNKLFVTMGRYQYIMVAQLQTISGLKRRAEGMLLYFKNKYNLK